MRLFLLVLIVGIYTVLATKYGNLVNIETLETYEDAMEAIEVNEEEYQKYNSLQNNLNKFINFNDYKCFTNLKKSCVINEDIFEQINFLNETIRNDTRLNSSDKKKFSTFVGNTKSINYLHYHYSKEFKRDENDQYFDEYQVFPVELYSYVGYFKYKQENETIIRISNYLDKTRHHAKNILDRITEIKNQLIEYNPETKKNYVRNYRNIRRRKNILWWNDVYYFWFG